MEGELLTMEALEWLQSINYKDYPHTKRMHLMKAAKILFSEESISPEGIQWLHSINYKDRNYAEREILLSAAKIIYPND